MKADVCDICDKVIPYSYVIIKLKKVIPDWEGSKYTNTIDVCQNCINEIKAKVIAKYENQRI
jgi:hypothetical protein